MGNISKRVPNILSYFCISELEAKMLTVTHIPTDISCLKSNSVKRDILVISIYIYESGANKKCRSPWIRTPDAKILYKKMFSCAE